MPHPHYHYHPKAQRRIREHARVDNDQIDSVKQSVRAVYLAKAIDAFERALSFSGCVDLTSAVSRKTFWEPVADGLQHVSDYTSFCRNQDNYIDWWCVEDSSGWIKHVTPEDRLLDYQLYRECCYYVRTLKDRRRKDYVTGVPGDIVEAIQGMDACVHQAIQILSRDLEYMGAPRTDLRRLAEVAPPKTPRLARATEVLSQWPFNLFTKNRDQGQETIDMPDPVAVPKRSAPLVVTMPPRERSARKPTPASTPTASQYSEPSRSRSDGSIPEPPKVQVSMAERPRRSGITSFMNRGPVNNPVVSTSIAPSATEVTEELPVEIIPAPEDEEPSVAAPTTVAATPTESVEQPAPSAKPKSEETDTGVQRMSLF